MLKLSIAGFYLVILTSFTSVAQTPVSPTVEEIISKAAAQREAYLQEFKNLLSQEIKTFEIFGKRGDVRKRRSVTSTFIVYQLSKDENVITEFRNVLAVDGKNIDNTERRAQDFFEKIQQAESSAKELDRLRDESSRYDEEIVIDGFTLFQAIPLIDKLRPYFQFRLEGKEMIGGTEVFVVSYKQKRQSPHIIVNSRRDAPKNETSLMYDIELDSDVELNERLSGKFWIDARTFQVWREHRVLTLQPDGFVTSVNLAENIFEFEKSPFGILTPKKISHTQFDLKRKDRSSIKDLAVTFEYANFTKPDVEVKSDEVKSNVNKP